MDGWMDGWSMDKRGDGQQDESIRRWMDEQMDGWLQAPALSGFPVVGGLPSLLSLV